ncbi:MAG: hypothetical protein JRI71_12605 [Deltaproteobacteria bacterium]|nr:hypothetical protein [Deltaproteobacteria bacterium]MBW2078365.1 hypothetical protein [Deltaproteobacteria bacterium]MBW2311593.1 hypothetical protein [Deltaproteobacteria bacterium]
MNLRQVRLSEGDLDFLIETACPEVMDKSRLKQILREDEDFRNSFISEEKLFERLMNDDEVFLKISPGLFFEILLRNAAKDLEKTSYTLEKTNTMKIPVFDTQDVIKLLSEESLLIYLAEMLSSFTKIQSYSITFRIRKGIWKKIRFNDMDIVSLMNFCEAVEDEYRLGFYKRIADICLFILGIFPDYAERDYRYPFSGELRPHIRGKLRISPEEYEQEGRKFYKLAAEHQSVKEMDLSEVFWILHSNFQKAKKPLNFIAEHYLHYRRDTFFG